VLVDVDRLVARRGRRRSVSPRGGVGRRRRWRRRRDGGSKRRAAARCWHPPGLRHRRVPRSPSLGCTGSGNDRTGSKFAQRLASVGAERPGASASAPSTVAHRRGERAAGRWIGKRLRRASDRREWPRQIRRATSAPPRGDLRGLAPAAPRRRAVHGRLEHQDARWRVRRRRTAGTRSVAVCPPATTVTSRVCGPACSGATKSHGRRRRTVRPAGPAAAAAPTPACSTRQAPRAAAPRSGRGSRPAARAGRPASQPRRARCTLQVARSARSARSAVGHHGGERANPKAPRPSSGGDAGSRQLTRSPSARGDATAAAASRLPAAAAGTPAIATVGAAAARSRHCGSGWSDATTAKASTIAQASQRSSGVVLRTTTSPRAATSTATSAAVAIDRVMAGAPAPAAAPARAS
jgi:hypothetical protein